jgi:hypothetical protein
MATSVMSFDRPVGYEARGSLAYDRMDEERKKRQMQEEQESMQKLFQNAGDPNYNQSTGNALKQNWGLGDSSGPSTMKWGNGPTERLEDIAPEPRKGIIESLKEGFGNARKDSGRMFQKTLSDASMGIGGEIGSLPGNLAHAYNPMNWIRSLVGGQSPSGRDMMLNPAINAPIVGIQSLMKLFGGNKPPEASPTGSTGMPAQPGQPAQGPVDPSIAAKLPAVLKQFGPEKTREFLKQKGLNPSAYGL